MSQPAPSILVKNAIGLTCAIVINFALSPNQWGATWTGVYIPMTTNLATNWEGFEEEDQGVVRPDVDLSMRPTHETYEAFQYAYQHFNLAIFEGELPHALITLQRKGRSFGYFSPKRMTREDGKTCDEIALNPVHFRDRGDLVTLSTLVHEMVHLWQAHFGSPGRGNYHNREWAEKMKHVGLYPSQSGEPGGKEIGEPMTHYILDDGLFKSFATQLIEGGFKITWGDAPRERHLRATTPAPALAGIDGTDAVVSLEPESKSGKRVKYTCPTCGLNAWSRHGAALKCGDHDEVMTPE